MKRLPHPPLWFLVSMVLTSACKKNATIILDTPSGSPGDVVTVDVQHAKVSKATSVKIAAEHAMIVASSDTALAFLVPALKPQQTQVTVTLDKKEISLPFQIEPSATERLWFNLKGSTITFLERQPSRETFMRDKSHSHNRLYLEFLDDAGEVLAVSYIDHPTALEVPSADGKGFNMIEQKGDVQFSVNVPVLAGLRKARLTTLNATAKDNAKVLGEVTIPIK
ncbi:IPT/TIG domain-containing protein [Chryseolinea lacunae]|uniref:IPT/TIG domain-containing protein n=1 Tax=Chryseolinea lacunae TaxID=2801331 RepID=A0ABS1KVJ6_9BACT|nr:IPT/TIG domain-containing protein [Chryseolinea lacunae]MBL0743439.1 IPT/TIG domain-containing protein [Chryseolinea lacunae]